MRRYIVVALLLVVAVGAFLFYRSQRDDAPPSSPPVEKIVINEAARTLVYLPLYHAQRRGYFAKEGVQVEIVTGGTATNAVAALISGDADIAQADPMYAPISQDSGSDVVVIGQIVGRIGLWAVARPDTATAFDAQSLRGKGLITHPKPMTAYTYASLRLEELGLTDDDLRVVEAKPGTELATYTAETRVPFLVGVEPTISLLESQGARIVYSWPEALGDRTFSGLMVRRASLSNRGKEFSAVLRAYQRALDDIARSDPEVLRTARTYFPSLEEPVLRRALGRLTTDQVFPRSIAITPESWNSAIAARRRIGDIKGTGAYQQNVAAQFTQNALN